MDPWLKDAPAVLEAWYPGLEHGHAVADLLFGDYNPSGKLPMTFPRRYEDSPAHPSRQSEPRTEKTLFHEGVLVGYRWFDAKAIEPLFPFGHGLSYTTFAYNKLAAEKRGDSLLVSCEISNSGTRAGAEVAQLYVGDPDCSVVRPPRELKAFRKVWLNPGESRRLEMELDARAFSFWDEKTHGWKLEPGTFVLELGSSSRDIRQKITVSRLTGLNTRRLPAPPPFFYPPGGNGMLDFPLSGTTLPMFCQAWRTGVIHRDSDGRKGEVCRGQTSKQFNSTAQREVMPHRVVGVDPAGRRHGGVVVLCARHPAVAI